MTAEVNSWRVAEAFEGRCVFVTGASGFLGKVLVEKLLYSIPQIKNIYLLIRPLKNLTPKERLEKILQSPIYGRIRASNEELFKKLVPIAGDLMEPDIGLNEADARLLCDQVAIVFHCAATVKFDEKLRVSIQMNVIGTQRLVALCHKMTQLISVVHASTAYANCDLAKTEERVYEPCIKPSKLIEATTWMSDSMLDAITPQLLGKRPNTYTFAKALAESQLMEDAQGLPLIIVRPSIIGAIWKEPLPGWTDNVNGPTGMFVAVGKGVLTNMCGSVKSKADMIPVDIVSSCLIVAAAHRANLKSDEVPIIHCSSGQLNPLTWNHIPIYLEKFFFKYPYNCYRAPSTHFHASRKLFLLNYYLKHYYPAYAIDIGLRLMGKKPEFVKIYGKVWNMVETLHYFTTRGWHFESKNVMKLWNSLSEEDRKVYNFDIRQLDWDRYLFDYLMGVKIYILKEKLEDLPKARSNLSRLKQIGLYTNAAAWALFVRLFAWRRTRKQKWTVWSLGFMLTYIYQNYSFRPKVYLKSVEEYRKTALPAYA